MLFEEARLPWKDIAFAQRHDPELWCADAPTAARISLRRPAVKRYNLQKAAP